MSANEFVGLSTEEVLKNRAQYGSNILPHEKQHKLFGIIKGIVTEPLFVLLLGAAVIYFLLGEINESIIMLIAIALVSGISLYQENRSRNAVDTLNKLTSPNVKVIREGKQTSVPTIELVMGDLIILADGEIVPADCLILKANDFSVNESILTGEALAIYKNEKSADTKIFQGTLIASGSCTAKITAIGSFTELGKIGQSLKEIKEVKTPLQIQIKQFTFSMVITGVVAFIIVWGINYYLSKSILTGLLQGLTIAMSVLPEEIPVAFSTFMALGAYRLYKQKVISRSPNTVEALGAATVICVDKTGTLTENKMEVAAIYDLLKDEITEYKNDEGIFNQVLEYAMWSSETEPFDQMEKSIHAAYKKFSPKDLRNEFKMIHEYPLSGEPPIMTHVYQNANKEFRIASKGGMESIIAQSNVDNKQIEKINKISNDFAKQGYRVLAVGKSETAINSLPANQNEFQFEFLGLIAFYDPPKKNIAEVIAQFYKAGINVKMITGDHAETALSIAEQIGMKNIPGVLTGKEITVMDETTLQEKVKSYSVFARMFPVAKLKVIEALKANGEVVAMTGDGVNDGPALKAAHIGISMGKRGSETAKKAATLILTDDDLAHMVDAIALGRRIYENLKKAIQYIISIHIPIILIVTLPLILFWDLTNFFSPIHVIFLELIMGPTCSIIFENEPIEKGSMLRAPRKMSNKFFSLRELFISIFQGLIITAGCLSLAFYYMKQGSSETEIRSLIYTTLIISNMLLTLVNRSFYFSVFTTLRYKNKLIPLIISISLVILLMSIYFPPVQKIFQFQPLTGLQFVICIATALVSVLWIEIYKISKRKKTEKQTV